jgi:Domain of unknown function (DUF1707)
MTEPRTPDVRASDAERERTAETLHAAAGDGRLTLDELEERLTAAYAARYRHELPALTADLPAPAPEDTGRLSPWSRVTALPPAFLVHVAIVAVLATTLLVRWAVLGTPWFWPAGPLFWLAVSVLIHARIRRLGPFADRGPQTP